MLIAFGAVRSTRAIATQYENEFLWNRGLVTDDPAWSVTSTAAPKLLNDPMPFSTAEYAQNRIQRRSSGRAISMVSTPEFCASPEVREMNGLDEREPRLR